MTVAVHVFCRLKKKKTCCFSVFLFHCSIISIKFWQFFFSEIIEDVLPILREMGKPFSGEQFFSYYFFICSVNLKKKQPYNSGAEITFVTLCF